MGLIDADDSVFYLVTFSQVHVPLLAAEFLYHQQFPIKFAFQQRQHCPHRHHVLDIANIPPNILKISSNDCPRFPYGMAAFLGIGQIFLSGLLAISSGLLRELFPDGLVQDIHHLLHQLTGLMQQSCVRRIVNVCRAAGRIQNQSSLVFCGCIG